MGIRDYIRTTVSVAEMAQERKERMAAPLPPPRCPPGWQVGPPDFVGVGVQKAGTSWWSRAIFSHPDVLDPVRKELRFFQHHWYEEFTAERIAEYQRYFPRTPGKVTGEWSPSYMLEPWTPGRLRRAAPDVRVLTILRDPVARLRSGLRHASYHYYGRPDPRLVTEAIEFGRYADQLDRLADVFPREQILVLQFERCLEDPEGELARTYRFIGADPGFVPADLRTPVNESKAPPVTVPGDIVEVARNLYREDIDRLRTGWPEIDPDLWPSLTDSSV